MGVRVGVQIWGGAVAEVVVLTLSLNRVVAVVFVGAIVGTALRAEVVMLAIGLPCIVAIVVVRSARTRPIIETPLAGATY